jgi:hypothetical protein
MLSDLIEATHIESFRLALFHLEGFDILGCEWSIDHKNRVQCSTVNADCWGDLGFVEDWYIERILPNKDEWSSSLSTTRSVYSKRRKTLKSLYSIGHRTKTRSRSVTGSKLPKRRRIFTVSPWNRFIESYLSDRRKKRLLTGDIIRYQPTDNDIESMSMNQSGVVGLAQAQCE